MWLGEGLTVETKVVWGVAGVGLGDLEVSLGGVASGGGHLVLWQQSRSSH